MKVKKSNVTSAKPAKRIGKSKSMRTKEYSPQVTDGETMTSQIPLKDPVRPGRANKMNVDAIPLLGYSKARTAIMSRLDT